MFKNIKKVSFKNFALNFFAIILFTVFITPNLKAQDNAGAVTVNLPTNVNGVAEIEYLVNGKSFGSAAGNTSAELKLGDTIRFLVKFEESAKNTYLKDVLINNDNTSSGLECVTGIKEDGTFITRTPNEDEKILTSTSYVSKQYITTSTDKVTFSIQPFLKLNLTLDFSSTGLTEDLKDIMGIECSAGSSATSVKTVENKDGKKYIVEGIEPNTNTELTIKPTSAFTQLKGLKITNSAGTNIESAITGAEGSTERTLTLGTLTSDETLTITGLVKNAYSISGTDINKTTAVTHGGSYEYTGTVRENKCLTANGIYVEPEKYTFNNITENIELEILEINEAKYKITPPSADSHVKIQLSGENEPSDKSYHTVNYNRPFSFKIVPDFGYNFDSGITVQSNGTKPTANQEYGTYTIKNITTNISISVTNVKPNIYAVEFPTAATTFTYEIIDGASGGSDGSYKVTHGTNVQVKVTPTDASKCVTTNNFTFTKMNENETSTTAKVALTSEDRTNNSYTFEISNITENTRVLISSLKNRTLTIDFKSDSSDESDIFNCINEKTEIYQENKTNAAYGSSITFKVVPNSEYEISSSGLGMKCTGNASLSGPDGNGYYTLQNITSDVTVTISGIKHKDVPVYIKIANQQLLYIRKTSDESGDNLTQYSTTVPYNTSDFCVWLTGGETSIAVKDLFEVNCYPDTLGQPKYGTADSSSEYDSMNSNAIYPLTFLKPITTPTAIIIQEKSQQSNTEGNVSPYKAWRLTDNYSVTATDVDINDNIIENSNSNNHIPHIGYNSTNGEYRWYAIKKLNTQEYIKSIKLNSAETTYKTNNNDAEQKYAAGGNNLFGQSDITSNKYYFVVCPKTLPGSKQYDADADAAADYDNWEFGRFRVNLTSTKTAGNTTQSFTGPGEYTLKEYPDSKIIITENPARYRKNAEANNYNDPKNEDHYDTEVKLNVILGETTLNTIATTQREANDPEIFNLFSDIKVEMLFNKKPQLCNCAVNFETPSETQGNIRFALLKEDNSNYSFDNTDLLNTSVTEDGSIYFAVLYNNTYKLESDSVSIFPSDAFQNISSIKKMNFEYVENAKLTAELPDGFTNYYIYKISAPRVEQAKVYISKFKKTSYEAKFLGTGSTYQNSNQEDIVKANVEHEQNFSFSIKSNKGFLNDKDTYIIISTNNAYALFYYDEKKSQTNEELNKSLGNITVKCKDGKFEIDLENVQNNFSVVTFRNRDTRKVIFDLPEGLKYEIISNSHTTESANKTENVQYQNNLEFRIVANDPKYDLSTITVTSNYSPIVLINGKYTLKEITEDTTIRVENLQIIKNKVTFTKYDHITYKNENGILLSTENDVDYGKSLSFKVILSEYYSNSEITINFEDENGNKGDIKLPVISMNNNQSANAESITSVEAGKDIPYISRNDRIITLNNITSNTRVFISGLKPNNYKIELVHHEGIKYYDETRQNELENSENLQVTTEQNSTIMEVAYGENLKFSIMGDDGYDISNLKVYYIGDNKDKVQKVLSVVNNVYTLENISENYKVIIEDVKKSVHQIEFRTVTGVNALDLFGKKLTQAQNITYGETYTFKLSLESAYNHSNPKVMIKGGNEIVPSSNGEYITPPIKENIIIEILDVKKNSYTVTFKDAEGVIYQNAKNKPFTGQQKIEYDGIFEFKISLMDAYDSSTPLVTINGNDDDIIESSSSSKLEYVLQGVESDIEIIVKNVVKNPEEITIEQVNDVPDKVVTYDDVEAVVKATKKYMNLSDEEREKVTNIANLQRAQKESAEITHYSEGMTAQNLDWNIRLIVTHLSDDKDKMKAFEKNIERRKLLTLYDIKLVDILTNKDYKVPEDDEITIELEAPNLDGYMNAVMAHQITNGNMEYLDLNVVENTAYFKTSSFSLFGIAAKDIPNYLKNSSDLKISVKDLVENEEQLKSLLGEGLVSQLGDILDEENSAQSNPVESFLKGNLDINKLAEQTKLTKIYTWALENEFLAVVLILLIGTLLIWLILKTSKKQKKKS